MLKVAGEIRAELKAAGITSRMVGVRMRGNAVILIDVKDHGVDEAKVFGIAREVYCRHPHAWLCISMQGRSGLSWPGLPS